jgi:alpha-glucosidase
VERHASRWRLTGPQVRLYLAVLLSLRGSVCLYQGEELGLTEAEIRFEDLVDPYGKRFWPLFKGRDGCRTPMVWDADALNGGFSEVRPWLPVADNHLLRAANRQAGDPGSVFTRYRDLLAFRRANPALRNGSITFWEAPEPVLLFVRESEGERILCGFNFGHQVVECDFGPVSVTPLEGHGFAGRTINNGHGIHLGGRDAFFGRIDQ